MRPATAKTPHNGDTAVIDLSLVIVNYNVRGFLEALLESVRETQGGLSLEVIVVDNGSTDGSVEMVRARYPETRLIANPDNRGFAAANNQALRISRGRYVCLVNPDVLLQEDTLQTMVGFMDAHPDVGAAGCKVLNPDGTLQLACRRSVPTPLTAFCKLTGLSRIFPRNRVTGAYNLTYLDPDAVHDVDAVSGSFMVVRRETMERGGLLDEAFFLYGEDLDWQYRMRRAGWRVCYVPATRIVHYKGESAKQSRLRAAVEFYRAMYIFARKHRPTRGVRLITVSVSWLVTAGIVVKGAVCLAWQALQRAAIPLADLACVNATPLIATYIRMGRLTPLTAETIMPYLIVHGVYSLVWMGCFYLSGLYGQRRYSASTAAAAVTAGFLVIAAVTYFAPTIAFSRAIVLLSWVFNLMVIAGWRWAASRLTGARRRAIVVGTDAAGRAIAAQLSNDPRSGYDVVGFLDTDPRAIGATTDGFTVLNGNGRLVDTIDTYRIDEVVIASSSMSYQDILQFVSSCTRLGVGLKLVAGSGAKNTDGFGAMQLVEVSADPFAYGRRLIRRLWKRR